ncbi:hypothetical protein [Viridibacterium curvum]|uniref:Uncharacterized protein n=1 Tax=Viridibacterium curvum TaxID=1101404 RepID=A0ABP9QAB9_9RHOO
MFERRQRAISAMHFNQVTRNLGANEALPALPGLAAQLMAFQSDVARNSRVQMDVSDELDLSADQDELGGD